MPSLAEIGDIDAVENRYLDKVIVYVEGDGDQKLFTEIVGPDVADKLEFRTPAVAGGGCSAVLKRVEVERPGNAKVYGLVDGETAVMLGGVDALLHCRRHLFSLPGIAPADGVLFLAGHELENLILLHGGVCELVSRNVKMANIGTVAVTEVEQTFLKLTRRFFLAALVKYAVSVANLRGAPIVSVRGGRLVESRLSVATWLRELKAAVQGAGGDWGIYRDEAEAILERLVAQFNTETLPDIERQSHFVRLSDGKHLLVALQKSFNPTLIADGILSSALTRPPYADEFRDELLQQTKAA